MPLCAYNRIMKRLLRRLKHTRALRRYGFHRDAVSMFHNRDLLFLLCWKQAWLSVPLCLWFLVIPSVLVNHNKEEIQDFSPSYFCVQYSQFVYACNFFWTCYYGQQIASQMHESLGFRWPSVLVCKNSCTVQELISTIFRNEGLIFFGSAYFSWSEEWY